MQKSELIYVKDTNGNVITETCYCDHVLEYILYYEFEDNTGKTYVNSVYDVCPIANNQLVKVERYENGKMVSKSIYSLKEDKRFNGDVHYRTYKRTYKIK